MELLFLDSLSFLENLDFTLIIYILGFVLCIFWLFVVGWVWFDASERYSSVWLKIFSAAIVLLFNILGFLVYLILRPRTTRDDNYWIDLERRYLKFEAAGLEDCPRCGWEVLPNYIFCPDCGEVLRRKCKSCEVYLEPEWDVCPFCGGHQRKFDLKEKVRKEKSVKKKGKKKQLETAKEPKVIKEKKPKKKSKPVKKRKKSIFGGMKKWFVGPDGLVRLKKTGSTTGPATGSTKNVKGKDRSKGREQNRGKNQGKSGGGDQGKDQGKNRGQNQSNDLDKTNDNVGSGTVEIRNKE